MLNMPLVASHCLIVFSPADILKEELSILVQVFRLLSLVVICSESCSNKQAIFVCESVTLIYGTLLNYTLQCELVPT